MGRRASRSGTSGYHEEGAAIYNRARARLGLSPYDPDAVSYAFSGTLHMIRSVPSVEQAQLPRLALLC